MIFSKIPDISLTAVKFPDISRFSRQVLTLNIILKEKGVMQTNMLTDVQHETFVVRRLQAYSSASLLSL